MKLYYTEDRSAGQTGKEAHPKVCNIIQLFELTDWVPEEMDKITSLDISEDLIVGMGVYVKRLV